MEKPCPFCGSPLQPWRFWNVEHLDDPGNEQWKRDYIDCCTANLPADMPIEHAVYHIPESC